MNRVIELDIAGKAYPLNFSVKAARTIDEKYGGIEKMAESFENEGVGKIMSVLSDVTHLLMEQGAAYERLINEKEIEVPSADDLEIMLGMQDFKVLQETLFKAMGIGAAPTVEVEPEKKGKAAQGK